jgi:hypothetical protein
MKEAAPRTDPETTRGIVDVTVFALEFCTGFILGDLSCRSDASS